MIDWICDKLIGGPSLRWRMTILYTIIFTVLSALGKLEAISFGTFSGVVGLWCVADTFRKSK